MEATLTFGQYLKQLRREHSYEHLEDLSAKLGFTRAWISQVECGARYPSPEGLKALADVYDMPLSELLYRYLYPDIVVCWDQFKQCQFLIDQMLELMYTQVAHRSR